MCAELPMIRMLGSERRLCGGLTRRDWLQVGGLGLLGLNLADFSRLREAQSADAQTTLGPQFGQAKSCILLLPYGSPGQHETFDPKPDAPAEVQGELKAVSTTVPGVQIGEHLPKLARIAERMTLVRSMSHPYPVHCVAYVTSGIPDYSPALETRPQDPKLWPYIGSVVDYVLERRTHGELPNVPRNMALPWKMNSRGGPVSSAVQAGPYAAFLGSAYDPVLTDFEGEGSREVIKMRPADGPKHHVRDPYAGIKPNGRFKLADTELPVAMTLDRRNRRRSLREQLDHARRQVDDSANTRSFDRYQNIAYSLLSSGAVHNAIDIHREPAALREAYGMHLFGQSCLAARRLVESGSKFVTVFWDEYGYLNTDWDTHWNQYYRLTDRLLPGLDSGLSALLTDLDERGLLDETLVVWMSEHGRTPRINSNAGRDHYSQVYSIAMAGGGIGRGQVVGASDRHAAEVAANPISPKDILATILYLLGIDPHTTIPDKLNRPVAVAGTGVVRSELFG